jgi:hypothetical protein
MTPLPPAIHFAGLTVLVAGDVTTPPIGDLKRRAPLFVPRTIEKIDLHFFIPGCVIEALGLPLVFIDIGP